MSMQLTIPEAIRRHLETALLDESDLIEFLRQARRDPIPGEPGKSRCVGTLPVRRPLDPETSQLVRVEVVLEQRGDGFEVAALRGLES